ncbi:MAG: hypothetical protein MZV64_70330 [Ignavibacteriales bacterium]|nr:hypothetical protein [Ignavibacteriales bacterium]
MKKLNPNAKIQSLALFSSCFNPACKFAACTNKGNQARWLLAISLTKMNVLYVGVDNPVVVAVSGYTSDEIEVSVTR